MFVFNKDSLIQFLCIFRKHIYSKIYAKNGFDLVMTIYSLWKISKSRWIYLTAVFQYGNLGPYIEGN